MKSFLENVTGSACNALKANSFSAVPLPLLPLGTVLFPGGTMVLKIFEQRYFDMAKICLKSGAPFGIALIREGAEVGPPAVPESIGTVAYVTDWDMQNLGVLQLRVRGAERFKLLSWKASKNGLIAGQVSMLADDTHVDCPELTACAEFLRKVFARPGAADNTGNQRFDNATWVGYRLTELLPFNNDVKQRMLALTDARIRLQILHQFLIDQRLIA